MTGSPFAMLAKQLGIDARAAAAQGGLGLNYGGHLATLQHEIENLKGTVSEVAHGTDYDILTISTEKRNPNSSAPSSPSSTTPPATA